VFASNVNLYFIILTIAATLDVHCLGNIETARGCSNGAATARREHGLPSLCLCLAGTGMPGVPVAGSCAYAISEAAPGAHSFIAHQRRAQSRSLTGSKGRWGIGGRRSPVQIMYAIPAPPEPNPSKGNIESGAPSKRWYALAGKERVRVARDSGTESALSEVRRKPCCTGR